MNEEEGLPEMGDQLLEMAPRIAAAAIRLDDPELYAIAAELLNSGELLKGRAKCRLPSSSLLAPSAPD